LLAAHAEVAPALARRGDELCAALHGWLADAGVKVHSVTARVKDAASLARKLARPDRSYTSLWDVTDLLGLRVITYFDDAVDRVAEVIEARLPIDLARSIDKRRRAAPGAFGYRSLHYVFALAGSGELPAAARGEIQVRTVLEHAWAEIEHDLGYKAPGAVPASVRHRLSRVAGLLEVADREFVAIRDELAAYAQALPRRIAAAEGEVPLDQLALGAVVASPAVVTLDETIAGAIDRGLGDEVFFPDYLVRMLQLAGLVTVGDVRAGLTVHAAAITAMAGPYFQFAWSTWRLAPAQGGRLPRGYALFFLAHVQVMAGAGLQLDKVERLARLYRELDYPDDAATAQQVASQLVAAVRGAVSGDVA
jgi:ppGpp synthetase/RelA/SpoT-type nucleotidyltranferase